MRTIGIGYTLLVGGTILLTATTVSARDWRDVLRTAANDKICTREIASHPVRDEDKVCRRGDAETVQMACTTAGCEN
jgi:hypothetical protein